MEDRTAYYNQFTRNLSDSNIAQEYYATRNLSKKILDDSLVGFCP
jgi:hypothetical protein